MMPIHDLGIGSYERFLPHKVVQHMSEHINGRVLYTRAHGHHAQIRGLRNQSSQQGFVKLRRSGLMALYGCEVLAETGELIHFHQQLLDADER